MVAWSVFDVSRSPHRIGLWRVLRRVSNVITVALFAITTACGGGGGGSSSGGDNTPPPSLAVTPMNFVSPDNGAPVLCCETEFILQNGSPAKYTGGVYEITIYNDSTGSDILAVSEPLTEDGTGVLRWTAPITLSENRAYWWSWKASYATGNAKSSIGVFYVMLKNALQALAPRNTGWMDANFAAIPTFAVFNVHNGSEITPTYNIELFMDSAMTAPIVSVVDLTQESGRYTTWRPPVKLTSGIAYYWRVRAMIGSYTTDWGGPYQFTVQNPCAISGGKYASYGIDWSSQRQCSELLLTDLTGALGAPNAGNNPWRNFLSLDDGGEAVLEMGSTVVDQSGMDIRIHQYVSSEPLELLVGPTEVGPWYSLGSIWCPETCEFDLAYAGVAYARYIRIRDLTSPAATCHSTAGADIDAVEALSVASGGSCASFGGAVVSAEPTVPSEIVHSVPDWIKGLWTVAEINMGTDFTGYGMTFAITDTGFEYHYPGCDVKGRLLMDPLAMPTVANWYVMAMDQVACTQVWDIPTSTGVIDAGYIWALDNGWLFYRSSFYNDIDFWAYIR